MSVLLCSKNKYNKKLGYQLSQGDIIKFGRVRFKVKDIGSYKHRSKNRKRNYDHTLDVSMNEKLLHDYSKRSKSVSKSKSKSIDQSNFQQNQTYQDDFEQENIIERLDSINTVEKQKIEQIKKEAQCRIWLAGEEEDEADSNPLISPCKCNGSLMYIHLQWLKQWLSSKIHTKLTEFTFSYNWKNL